VKRLLVTVLSMEAVVCLLAIVPAKQLGHASAATAGAVCGAVALVALLLCGYVGRGRTALYVGSVFQAAVIATGVVLSSMYVIGGIFAALWFTGIWLGRKWESNPPAPRPDPAAPPASPRPDPGEAARR
jgi:hypothetical protein